MHPFIKFRNKLLRYGLEAFGLYYATYEGVVTNIDDPENRARIKIKCPAVYGSAEYPKWVLPLGMFVGKGIGFYALPQVGDNVWITFKNGNPEFPIWTYGWYPQKTAHEEAEPGKFLFSTPAGYKLLFDEKEGKIQLYFDEKTQMVFDKNKVHLFRDGKELNFTKDEVKLNFDSSELKLSKNKLEVNVNGVNLMSFLETVMNISKDGIMVGSAGPYKWSPATLALYEKHIIELKKFMK